MNNAVVSSGKVQRLVLITGNYSQCLPPDQSVPNGFNQASCGSSSGGSTDPKAPSKPSTPPSQPSTPSTPGSGTTGNTGGNTGGSCGALSGSKTGYATTTVSIYLPRSIEANYGTDTSSLQRYYDGQKGACGCGSGNSMSQWQIGSNGVLTAAGSAALFDDGGDSSWCGSGCGTCYELTNANAIAATGQGSCAGAGSKITVMVTNLCPANGNEVWCTAPNQYGYGAHFDIMSQGNPNGNWDNPVVQYKKVACPVDLAGNFQTCECAGGAKKSRVRRGLVQGRSLEG
ncbi:uncharacterized protein KY384_003801 [Bacidia gigantensis]|uniref:uncharacterized protein n=1 Tax=Bacidia gigantensis TaxID=2732470 RepID=UPI001D03F306|nr:uncharacterized protein KY384_003801 [Bacidia gigantensis]KAG8532161.1 hypothetical protein KY384_003801 [Bacidia gigantensis]